MPTEIGEIDVVMRRIAQSGKIGLVQWILYANKRKLKNKKRVK